MRKKLFGLCLIALILAFSPVTSQGETYLISGWVDANKTWDDDSNMCWAAAASNILAWGRWDVAPYFTAGDIFNHFKATWPNIGGQPLWGYTWWLNGIITSAPLTVPGGNFWPTYNYRNKFDIASSPSPSYIDTFLHAGYGVTLGLENSAGTSHAITCWGYNYNPASSQYYTHLYITDSDDSIEALQTYAIGRDSSGTWSFTDGSLIGWHLTSVEGFEKRESWDIYVPPHFDLLDPTKTKIKNIFKLEPFLSFDYKWGDIPHPGDPQKNRFFVQIQTPNGNRQTLFETFYQPQDQETGWHSINLAIPAEYQGLQTLLFGLEGGGSVTLYRLDPAAPLPGTLWLVATGLGGLLALRRKNRPG